MSSNPNGNGKIISVIKEYASPILLTIVGTFMWRDISEMRTDLKILLLQQSANKVKIDVMESDIAMLKEAVLVSKIKDNATIKFYPPQPAKKEDETTVN